MRMYINYTNSVNKSRSSFTLIELLVVLALVAILSVVVVMTLNPAELLKQARDSNRLSDLATINTALNLFSTDVIGGFMGTSTVVYVSLPDNSSSTCGSWGLPALPAGYIYNCVTSQNLRNTNGTGWIPVNFNRISSNSPISQLPIDPINTTSTRLYYTYISGGSWELNASIEAIKNKLGGSNDLVSKDGGSSLSSYEIGNNLTLNPIESGDPSLVGYWNYENNLLDNSGNRNNATWNGTSTQRYVAGKVGSYAGYYNGSTDSFTSANPAYSPSAITINAWIKSSGGDLHSAILNTGTVLFSAYPGQVYFWPDTQNYMTGIASSLAQWTMVTAVWDYQSNTGALYENGIRKLSPSNAAPARKAWTALGSGCWTAQNCFSGNIDDLRVYSRALSDAEILGIYNATK